MSTRRSSRRVFWHPARRSEHGIAVSPESPKSSRSGYSWIPPIKVSVTIGGMLARGAADLQRRCGSGVFDGEGSVRLAVPPDRGLRGEPAAACGSRLAGNGRLDALPTPEDAGRAAALPELGPAVAPACALSGHRCVIPCRPMNELHEAPRSEPRRPRLRASDRRTPHPHRHPRPLCDPRHSRHAARRLTATGKKGALTPRRFVQQRRVEDNRRVPIFLRKKVRCANQFDQNPSPAGSPSCDRMEPERDGFFVPLWLMRTISGTKLLRALKNVPFILPRSRPVKIRSNRIAPPSRPSCHPEIVEFSR